MAADEVGILENKKLSGNLEWGKGTVEETDIIEYNRKTLKAFENKLASPEGTKTKANYMKMLGYLIEGVKPRGKRKHGRPPKILVEGIKKPLFKSKKDTKKGITIYYLDEDTATDEDLYRFYNDYKKGKKPRTQKLMAISIRQLYKIMMGYVKRGELPDIIKGIKPPRINDADVKIYPTPEETVSILDACTHPRDRALLSGNYETATGSRPEKEWLSLKIGDIRIEKNVAYVTIRESKTVSRVTVIKKFVNDLKAWLNIHPDGSNPKAFVWCVLTGATYGERMSYANADRILKRACRKAGTKPYPFRAFRHRRAKDLETVLSIREKMAYMGWRSINTAKIYGNFTSEEACETVIAKEEGRSVKRESDALQNWICEGCKSSNPVTYNWCGVCGAPKDDIAAIQRTKVEKLIDLFLELVTKDKVIKQRVEELLT